MSNLVRSVAASTLLQDQFAMPTRTIRLSHCHLLDVLKLLAILFIVCGHSIIGSGQDKSTYSYGLTFDHFYIYCEFFFMVTGFYLAAHALRRPSESSLCFMLGKYRRFMPMHLMCLFLLVWAQNDFSLSLSLWPRVFSQYPDLIQEALLVHRWGVTSFVINNPDWFLSALLLGSLLIHALFSCAVRTSSLAGFRALALILCIAFYALILRTRGDLGPFATPIWGFTDLSVIRASADLLLGALLFISLGNTESSSVPRFGTAGECGAVMLFMLPLLVLHGTRSGEILSLLCFVPALQLATSSRGLLSRLCALKFFQYLCTLQLALYLGHWLFAFNYSHIAPLLPDAFATPSLLSDFILCIALSIALRAAELSLRRGYNALKDGSYRLVTKLLQNDTGESISYPPPSKISSTTVGDTTGTR